jgi:hypothetical protein
MDNQFETADRPPKQRGFFDRPAGVDFWLSVGGRFWGGLFIGLGIGLFMGASLIKDKIVPTDSGLWVGAWLVLFSLGLIITQRAVRRSDLGTERSAER